MNKKKILAGLLALQASVAQLIGAFEDEGNSAEASTPEKKTSSTKQTSAKSAESTSTPDPKATANITAETLAKMSYNDIKSLCKKLGVSPVGNRTELEARLLGTSAPVEDTEDATQDIEEAKDNLAEDDTHAKILEMTAEMSNEEIADILADVGVSPKGKRELLITKLEKAVEEGLLSLDEEEEEEEPPKAPEKSAPKSKEKEAPKKSKKKEPEPVEETDDEDDVNDFENNGDITDERAEACQEYRTEVENSDMDRSEMETFIKDFYGEDEDLSEVSDEDILETYIDLSLRYIDDDGDLIEEDGNAYMLNGAVACCGRHCTQSEDTGKYICEKCGEEYEIEE